jgi:group I intron endonuclease
MTCGVYQIFIEDYCYWGSSGNCEKRCSDHLNSLKRGKHDNTKMQNVFNKYKSFDFQIIVACDDRDVAYAYEQDYIDAHFGLDKCLNLNAAASKPPSQKGKKLTDEHRANLSAAQKGRKLTDEHKAKLSGPKNDEHKSKLSAAKKNATKLQCLHCLRSFDSGNFKRYHGDNCKKKLQQVENNPEISQDAEYIRLSAQS